MVLGKLPVPGRPKTLMIVRQGSSFSPSLETARLKYCLKGPLNPQTTNQLSTYI